MENAAGHNTPINCAANVSARIEAVSNQGKMTNRQENQTKLRESVQIQVERPNYEKIVQMIEKLSKEHPEMWKSGKTRPIGGQSLKQSKFKKCTWKDGWVWWKS